MPDDPSSNLQDVSERVRGSQSHNMHRVVGFEPLAPAAFFVRIILTFLGAQQATSGPTEGPAAAGKLLLPSLLLCCGLWTAAFLVKVRALLPNAWWLHDEESPGPTPRCGPYHPACMRHQAGRLHRQGQNTEQSCMQNPKLTCALCGTGCLRWALSYQR